MNHDTEPQRSPLVTTREAAVAFSEGFKVFLWGLALLVLFYACDGRVF